MKYIDEITHMHLYVYLFLLKFIFTVFVAIWFGTTIFHSDFIRISESCINDLFELFTSTMFLVMAMMVDHLP